jgi:hypothetical protein
MFGGMVVLCRRFIEKASRVIEGPFHVSVLLFVALFHRIFHITGNFIFSAVPFDGCVGTFRFMTQKERANCRGRFRRDGCLDASQQPLIEKTYPQGRIGLMLHGYES